MCVCVCVRWRERVGKSEAALLKMGVGRREETGNARWEGSTACGMSATASTKKEFMKM